MAFERKTPLGMGGRVPLGLPAQAEPEAAARAMRERIVLLARDLPAAPEIFSRLTEILQSPICDMEEVADLVSLDPAIAGQVLAKANSAFFRGEQGVGSVHDAALRLGVVEVHRLVGVSMAARLFSESIALYRLSGESLWSNSVAGALAMEALARHAGVDTHEAYTLGLLRQLGMLALGEVVKREQWDLVCPDDVDLLAWEQTRLDINHLEATAEILQAWRMPARMGVAVRHSVDLAAPERTPWPALLHLSGWVVEQVRLHIPAEKGLWRISPAVCDLAGISEELAHSVVDETATEWDALRVMMA